MNSKLNVFGMLGPDELSTIFTNLDFIDILRLCTINNNFNTVCGKEHLWKNILVSNYEISCPLDGKTWKDTAKIFGHGYLISEDKVLVDEKTFYETLNDEKFRALDVQHLYSTRRKFIYKSLELENYEEIILEDTREFYSACEWMDTEEHGEFCGYYPFKLDKEIILSIFQG